MNPVRINDSIDVQTLTEIAELCKLAGAAGSTLIFCCKELIVYYNDPQTDGVNEADFADELHIRHQKYARIFIAIFPVIK